MILRYFYTLILTTVFLGALLSGCSDDLEVRDGINEPFDGDITLSINIPEAEVVKTRAEDTSAEKAISSTLKHYALVYSSTSDSKPDKLLKIQELTSSEITSGSVTINVPRAQSTNPKIVVMANVPTDAGFSSIGLNSDYTDLLKLKNTLAVSSTSVTAPASPFVMSGVATGSGGSYSVSIQRAAAKVSVELNTSVTDFTLSGYTMYNAPNVGYCAAASALGSGYSSSPSDYVFNSGTYTIAATKVGSLYQNYTYPVKSLGNSTKTSETGAGAYFIVEGKYNNETCYYRVDLAGDATNGGYYDIKPNHWYQVEITKVYRKGYPTATEAAKRVMDQEDIDEKRIDVTIHDHVAEVLSIVTDGVRELGVSDRIELKSTGSEILSIKIYGPDTSKAPNVAYKTGSRWLSVGTPESKGNTTETSGNHTGDTDSTGELYEVELKLKSGTSIYADEDAVLIVTWEGLSVEVQVNYNADFKPEDAMTAKLTITNTNNSSNSATIENYWHFLAQKGSLTGRGGTSTTSPYLFGVGNTQMADGKVRNEGLHFPMPHGYTESNPWTYTYELDFSKLGSVTGVEVEYSEDSFFSDANITKEPSGSKITLSLSSAAKTSYTYAVGKAKFIVHISGTDDVEVPVDVYHTGFFNYDNSSSSDTDKGYYYYEVVALGKYHWLDRNVGAKSNMMYSDNGTNGTVGNSDAKGRFYTVASPGNNFGDPTINDFANSSMSTSYTICPPGYHVPNTTEWDNLRLATNFTTETFTDNGTSYLANFYKSSNLKIGNVYFPKSKYYNQDNSNGTQYVTSTPNVGDNGAGYYWTRVKSSGLEKDQIGQWLKALNINGASNTYINGSIKNNKMNLRCVAGNKPQDDDQFAIDFNVKGATHVYLYSVDNEGNKSGIFTFPGKAIGSQSAVDALDYTLTTSGTGFKSDDSYLHFSYTSSVDGEKLYVLFAYVSDSGKITVLSNRGDELVTTTANVKDAIGWEVKNNYNYFFYPNNGDHSNPNASQTRIFEVATTGSGSGGGGGETKEYAFPYGKRLYVKWQKMVPKTQDGITENKDMYRITIWFPKGASPTGGFPGGWQNGKIDKIGDVEFYNYSNRSDNEGFVIPENADYFWVILSNGSSSAQTSDIQVTKDTFDYTKDASGNITVWIKDVKARN